MSHRKNPNQPRPQKRCWCGSGKKEKNCHGRRSDEESVPRQPIASANGEIQRPKVSVHPWGVPGEEHRVIVAPILKGFSRPTPADLRGARGRYKVQLLLGRPGYPIQEEKNYQFIDNVTGTSHLRIAKPEKDRKGDDVEKIVLEFLGKPYQLVGISNKDGFLGKFTCELEANDSQHAETEAYGSLAPFLSLWSMNADIPIHVETIQVTNLTNHVSSLRIMTPHFEMNIAGGIHPPFREEFCQYASIYREGLNTNSFFYRFLCFYKIIESLIAKRGRESAATRQAGRDPRRNYEVIPEKPDELLALLKRLYPWRTTWDAMALSQIFPPEVLGAKVTAIRDKYFAPLRIGIAHGLLNTGEIKIVLDKMDYIQAVNKWLPLCRICARWMLLTDFPAECSLGMK